MALVTPVIFQVVGYQNSGKTTITSNLIKTLAAKGVKTVTIKHHGHGGRPEKPPLKDTDKHLHAGALASIIEGNGSILLQAENHYYSLDDQIELMKFFQPDVIIIEGYKFESFPKLLIVRSEDDLPLLNKVSNIAAIVYWKDKLYLKITSETNVPCFHIDDKMGISWTLEFLLKLVYKNDPKR
ncbi:molybdopterin-guanine dinucleotide biosynthesis protein B [Bacillus sp. sid0103]|uniref:molybdopterin-guanine dinucleotide biosynthesis protein B n=1 Tax=Bacillus sp. sid0103 TaxID=2856337 RepID=UPI001C47CEB8|nr:molybdopterin-guanine dinucleotide biosynthesis protein B [Bacillus sp. sid0103]MBV7508538.1 molybdopterin-guanine dinucleotide biosynthesis protein B [Bacillus sp. sid0103]